LLRPRRSTSLRRSHASPRLSRFRRVAVSAGALHSQQAKTAEEKAVWSLIEARGTGHPKITDDIVFVSGHYPRPIVGRRQVVAERTATDRADVAPINHPVLKTRPQTVAVSKSGDMAYGFALFDMEFDRPDSAGKTEHMKFEGSQLTVWRKNSW
jgi:ketosteroid isomerase-like protein